MEEGEREKLEHFGWTRLTTISAKIEERYLNSPWKSTRYQFTFLKK